jgi:nuclear GTP-binding protein
MNNTCPVLWPVLGDWNSGKIKYFTHPPETVAGDIASEIVSEFAKEFSLDTLDMDNDMDTLPVVRPRYGARKGNTVY